MYNRLQEEYDFAEGVTGGDKVAAAILCLAEKVRELNMEVREAKDVLKDFDQQICMGVQYGLFPQGEHSAGIPVNNLE